MKQRTWIRRIFAAVLLLSLVIGMALADSWPDESVTDANGDTWKKVPQEDGGFQIWQFVGIFGDKESALQAVGLKEEDAEKDPVSGAAEEAEQWKKVKFGKRKYKARANRKTFSWKTTLKRTKDKAGGTYTDTGKRKVLSKKKLKKKQQNTYRLDDVGNNTVMFNNIYLQDSTGSGV